MSICATAVFCGGVERKLHRVLLPLFGNSTSKRPFSLVNPFSVGIDRTRTARLKLPCGNVNLSLHCKSNGSVTPAALFSRTSCVWRCQPRRCHPAVMRNGNLLGGIAAWRGKNGFLKVTFGIWNYSNSIGHGGIFTRQPQKGLIEPAVNLYDMKFNCLHENVCKKCHLCVSAPPFCFSLNLRGKIYTFPCQGICNSAVLSNNNKKR